VGENGRIVKHLARPADAVAARDVVLSNSKATTQKWTNYDKLPEMPFWGCKKNIQIKVFPRLLFVVCLLLFPVYCIPLDEYTFTTTEALWVSFQGAISIQTKSAKFPSKWV